MNKIEATFRIVTPMFIGGADQNKIELRAPSIKGALRFWYRALYPTANTSEEFRIFGGAGDDSGQSCFLLRLSDVCIAEGGKEDKRWAESKITYLGYGVIMRMNTKGKYKDKHGNEKEIKKYMTVRPYACEGSTFTLTILFKPLKTSTSKNEYDADILKVKRALWGLIMFGGLGARSRKGFGSIVAKKINGMDELPPLIPESICNKDDLINSIKEFFNTIAPYQATDNIYPEYTCFSNYSHCFVTDEQDDSMAALEWLGETIHKYRSYKSTTYRLPWVDIDHDLMRDWIGCKVEPKAPPIRTAFGLPHNYFFTSLGNKKGDVNLMDNNNKGRRAAPVFYSIHDLPQSGGRRKACIVATFLPARLIPEGQKVRLDSNNHSNALELVLPDDFSAVTDLLGKIAKDGNGTEVWCNV